MDEPHLKLKPTDQLVTIMQMDDGKRLIARVWRGISSAGAEVECLMMGITTPAKNDLQKEFPMLLEHRDENSERVH